MLRLLATANVPSLLILVTLIMEAILSSETSVLTRAVWHNIPEDGILYSLYGSSAISCASEIYPPLGGSN
jgi:hypothetical protein